MNDETWERVKQELPEAVLKELENRTTSAGLLVPKEVEISEEIQKHLPRFGSFAASCEVNWQRESNRMYDHRDKPLTALVTPTTRDSYPPGVGKGGSRKLLSRISRKKLTGRRR